MLQEQRTTVIGNMSQEICVAGLPVSAEVGHLETLLSKPPPLAGLACGEARVSTYL